VRFTGVVRAGDRVRLQQTLAAVTPVKGGVRLTMTPTMQIDGSERPALVADFTFMAFT
jgi:acyl dehydratase